MKQPIPIRPRRMVAHARDLANHQSGRGRPLLTWLRRSTSAAYYAVFHGIALAVARQVGSGLPEEDCARLTRSVGHGKIDEVCRWVLAGKQAGKKHVEPIVAEIHADRTVVRLATIFRDLQQARHEADYDHLSVFHKARVLDLVEQAEEALGLIDQLPGSDNGRRFLALIGLHTQLR